MELVQQYMKKDYYSNTAAKWGYIYAQTTVRWTTSNIGVIKKPQELVNRYLRIKLMKNNPILLAC